MFCPSGGDVYEVDGIDVHSSGGIAAMGNRISFKKTGFGFVPLMCFRKRVPGFVVLRPRFVYWNRIGLRILSMVGGEIFSKASVTSNESAPKIST